jgi:DNA-binding response OmpR family regulator
MQTYNYPMSPDRLDKAFIPGIDLDAAHSSRRRRVLIVDDDPEYVHLMKLILRQSDFDVAGAHDCYGALDKYAEFRPDVVLLDLSMPGIDGWSTLELLKKSGDVPVIIVSANANRDDVVKGLLIGVDDYITKPFYNPEVVARIQAVLRRASGNGLVRERIFPEIGLRIDFERQEAHLAGQSHLLQPREFEALSLLAADAPRIVTYEKLTTEIWGAATAQNRIRLKNVILSLRKKLEVDPSNPTLVLNRRSVGYSLATDPEKSPDTNIEENER